MKIIDFDFYDSKRHRNVPVTVYLSEKANTISPIVIFNPGYQSQEELLKDFLVHKHYIYLAEYFTKKGFAFITIQHDIIGDVDGLESVDPNTNQHEARKHLYERGSANILFALEKLKETNIPLTFDKFIIGGHSNGGDIAKYFISHYPQYTSDIFIFDARRARLEPKSQIKLLMFEADDTTTDLGVFPMPNLEDNSKRSNIDWTVLKPTGALHASYTDDYLTDDLKIKILRALDWFLEK